MAPSYAYQDSFPPQTGRVQYVPYFQTTPEAVPSKMMVDPSSVPMFHGAGPYGANYSYPYHSCCNHVPFHGPYGYSPSCPPLLLSQPSPWCGSYAVYPPIFPVHHAPPAYAAGIPRYEYDKDATRPGNHHCCGCPNHVCSSQKGEQSVRVESPEEPLPLNSRNFRYPIVWIPPEYVKNDEGKGPSESKPTGTSQDVRSQGRSSQQEPSWTSLLPVQLEDLGLQKPGEGDPRKGISQQLGDKRKQFSYPVIWMPYAKQDEVERDQKDVFPKFSHQGLPSNSNANSAKNFIANDKVGESEVEGEAGTNTASKHAGEKNIPVKEAEASAGNVHREDAWNRATDASRNGVADKGKVSSGRKEPVSPKEKPKLPPVCLRVDPLPRRKRSTGGSRSPSPPGAREIASPVVDGNKERNPPAEVANRKKFDKEKGKQVKVIEVKNSPTGKKDEEMVIEREVEHPVMSNSIGRDEGSKREEVGKGASAYEKTEEKKETVARPLSGGEAATVIQAAYRGFEVRKWETKKKLKQLARIRNEVAKIKKSIQELESSHNASLDHREKFTKQRMVIGESIMSLLLTLDTIQGLHPSLRDVRKSLARELVTLQDMLDSLVNKTEHIEKRSSASPEEYMHEFSAEDTNKRQQKSDKEYSQPLEPICEYNGSIATDNVLESPEVHPLDAEASLPSPLEVESSGEMVDADYSGQGLASSDMNCVDEEVKSDQWNEQVSEFKKSLEDGKCENMKEDSDDASSNEAVKIDASMGHEDPMSHDQEKGTELPVENEELDGSSADEKERPPDNGGDVLPAALHEEGAFAFPSEEVTMGEPMEERASVPMNGKEGQHPQEEDGGELLPVTSFQDEESTLQSEESTTPGPREDEMANNTEALTGKEEELDKQVDGNTGEGWTREKEMEEKQGQCDAHGPVRIDVQKILGNPNVAEVPDEQDIVVAVEDVPASEGAEALVDESKSGNSIRCDELESNEKLLAENEKLREMMQKLMEAGKEQLDVIAGLTGRVKVGEETGKEQETEIKTKQDLCSSSIVSYKAVC